MYNVNLLLKINYQSKGSIRIFTVVCTYVSNIMSIKNCFIEARQGSKTNWFMGRPLPPLLTLLVDPQGTAHMKEYDSDQSRILWWLTCSRK